MRGSVRSALLVVAVAAAGFPIVAMESINAVPNPVATDEGTYLAFGRTFPDPHGCLAYGVPDLDGDGVKDTPRGVSPWAKARVCADQFLSYEEVIEGSKFLARRFPEFLKVIRLDQAYDNPNYMSAGIPRNVVVDDGTPKALGRDRRPLYMMKVTDKTSEIPEADREHFVYTMSIHGIERAGVEGGVRAMEDLVTWAACELPKYNASTPPTPACAVEGPFPKKIVETKTDKPVPTAGEVLDRSVVYFALPNPDGWARGQVAPVEVEDGSPNVNYTPGFFYQRYNGNGVDLNRDWPTKGYSYKPYSPGSEPEIKAYTEVLKGIRNFTSANQFSGGIDLHGMITAYAFSYTLLGAGQRDYRKNALSVDTSIRTWQDQTKRMGWSPYIADVNANGQNDAGETCVVENVVGGGTRGRVPACVADQWGTVIDTIGYQVTGSAGDWIDSPIGLNAVGIDNEMYASHLAPNTVFDPALEQTHIDGNKGLIYSQIASLLTTGDVTYRPSGKVGYVFNPERLRIDKDARPENPGLPAQNDIDVLVPCQGAAVQDVGAAMPCGGGSFKVENGTPVFEFDVLGPDEGIWNGGITVEVTKPNALGVSEGNVAGMQLQYFDEGQWHTAAGDYNQSFLYLQAGAIITANDPQTGRWRVVLSPTSAFPLRLDIDFHPVTSEMSPGQAEIDASSMDFFKELNRYVPEASEVEKVPVSALAGDPAALDAFESLIVVNNLGSRQYLIDKLGLSGAEADAYFAGLKGFAQRGGNLVLTDAALQATQEIGLVAAGSVKRVVSQSETTAGNFAFQIANGNITYTNPEKYPLAKDVNLPGAAEQQPGRRQAVEPTPLGYSPDYGEDRAPETQLPSWNIAKPAWLSACGLPDCMTASTTTNGNVVNLGEAKLGAGRVRIAGIMFPDPVYAPDADSDNRFGLASYSLTYTAYEVFENLIDYRRA